MTTEEGLSPYDVFKKTGCRDHMISTNIQLLYTPLPGFKDKLFVIEDIGDYEFIVTDCDDLTENDIKRYTIMREKIYRIEREKDIEDDLEHYQYSQGFVKFLNL